MINGMSAEVQIVNDKGRLGPDEINQMLQDAEKFRSEDEAVRKNMDHMSKLQNCAQNMLTFIESPQYVNMITP